MGIMVYSLLLWVMQDLYHQLCFMYIYIYTHIDIHMQRLSGLQGFRSASCQNIWTDGGSLSLSPQQETRVCQIQKSRSQWLPSALDPGLDIWASFLQVRAAFRCSGSSKCTLSGTAATSLKAPARF